MEKDLPAPRSSERLRKLKRGRLAEEEDGRPPEMRKRGKTGMKEKKAKGTKDLTEQEEVPHRADESMGQHSMQNEPPATVVLHQPGASHAVREEPDRVTLQGGASSKQALSSKAAQDGTDVKRQGTVAPQKRAPEGGPLQVQQLDAGVPSKRTGAGLELSADASEGAVRETELSSARVSTGESEDVMLPVIQDGVGAAVAGKTEIGKGRCSEELSAGMAEGGEGGGSADAVLPAFWLELMRGLPDDVASAVKPFVGDLVAKGYQTVPLLKCATRASLLAEPPLPLAVVDVLTKYFLTQEPQLYTAREAFSLEVPELTLRQSPRSSRSKTSPAAPRTFSSIQVWAEADAEMDDLRLQLDDVERIHAPVRVSGPQNKWLPAAEEGEVRGPLSMLAPLVNGVAKQLGIQAELAGAGNRTLSSTNWCTRLLSLAWQQGRARNVGGVVEVKGDWQWDLQVWETLESVLGDPARQKKLLNAFQLSYGDMVLDEAPVGAITRWNVTVLLRRSQDVRDKTLYVTQPIGADKLLLASLYLLKKSAELAHWKHGLKRNLVTITPPGGYHPSLPSPYHLPRAKRKDKSGQGAQTSDKTQGGRCRPLFLEPSCGAEQAADDIDEESARKGALSGKFSLDKGAEDEGNGHWERRNGVDVEEGSRCREARNGPHAAGGSCMIAVEDGVDCTRGGDCLKGLPRAPPKDSCLALAGLYSPGLLGAAEGAHGNEADGNGADGNGAHGNGADGNGADGNGAHGNGADGNGAHGNGADGNGAHGNGADGNGADGNGADGNGATADPTGAAKVGSTDCARTFGSGRIDAGGSGADGFPDDQGIGHGGCWEQEGRRSGRDEPAVASSNIRHSAEAEWGSQSLSSVSEDEAEDCGADLRSFGFGDLQIADEPLAEGSSGWILQGEWEGKDVAIKWFDPRLRGRGGKFWREVSVYRLCGDLQGKTVPTLHGVGRLLHVNAPFVALSFEGESIDEGMANEAAKTGMRAALASLHVKRIAHGDIHLRNFVLKDGAVKVVDFGSATLNAEEEVLAEEKQELEVLLDSIASGLYA